MGKIRAQKGLLGIPTTEAEFIPADERPFEIPPNWVWLRLGDVCSKTGSGNTPRFIAPVIDEGATLPPDIGTQKQGVAPELAVPPQTNASRKHYLQRLAIIAILGVAVATAMAGHFWFVRGNAALSSSNAKSIAVLPFADMSPAKDQEYFSDGLAEQLIHELAKVSGLKVVGRSSAFQFSGKNEDLREVGRKLGVANILEGSVRREGNHVRITADLIKADDGFQRWSRSGDQ